MPRRIPTPPFSRIRLGFVDRELWTTALEVFGLFLVVVGFVLVWVPLGFIVGGVAAMGAGFLLSDDDGVV